MGRDTGNVALGPEDLKEWEKTGRVPAKRKVAALPEPERPEIKDLIPKGKVKPENVKGAPTGRMSNRRNDEGMVFTGFNVSFELKEGKPVHGWMEDGVYCELRRLLSFEDDVNISRME